VSRLETTFTRGWQRRGALALAMWPAALLFGVVSGLRAWLYAAGVLRSTRLPVPVVIVGNIFVGGTGKTPLTIWLVDALRRAGWRPGVISRGHGGAAGTVRAVQHGALAREVGDEPLLIATSARCPVYVGRDRVAAGQALLADHPEVNLIVSDDGLQHYRLQRDVEVLLFDGRGVGNGWLLPAGPLRERPGRRRDATVINTLQLTAALAAQLPQPAFQMRLAGNTAFRLMQRQEGMSLLELAARGWQIVAAAGIGHPERFFSMLAASGLQFERLPLPDHYDFADNPFAAIDAEVILITEKDAVKCRQLEHLKNDPRLWVVPVAAQLDDALAELIVEKCRGRKVA
jgi:tetraacyldisaccharide 4'-kinase